MRARLSPGKRHEPLVHKAQNPAFIIITFQSPVAAHKTHCFPFSCSQLIFHLKSSPLSPAHTCVSQLTVSTFSTSISKSHTADLKATFSKFSVWGKNTIGKRPEMEVFGFFRYLGLNPVCRCIPAFVKKDVSLPWLARLPFCDLKKQRNFARVVKMHVHR